MIEVTGNLWEYPADVRVITTNGTVKRDGTCVMGRGCAAEAKTRWPALPKMLGESIMEHGNVVASFYMADDTLLLSFPVKHQWMENADPALIMRSAMQLADTVNDRSWKRIVMPRPGCGNGNLRWEDVEPILEPILDSRFHVITFEASPRTQGGSESSRPFPEPWATPKRR